MSLDVVDDLEAYEDLAAHLFEALSELVAVCAICLPTLIEDFDETRKALEKARQAIASHNNFCRPTCGARDRDESDEDEDGHDYYLNDDGTIGETTCGCPCHTRSS